MAVLVEKVEGAAWGSDASRHSYTLQVFVPSKDESEVIVAFQKFGWFRAGFLAVQCLIGWHLYLFFNAAGREYSRFANHFDPTSPIFSKRERPGVSTRCRGPTRLCLTLTRA